MAAPTTPLSGIQSLIVVGGVVVGAQTDATLNLPSEVVDIATKNDFGWQQSLPGVKSFSLDTGNLIKDTTGKPFISNDQPNRVSVTFDTIQLDELTSVEVSLSQDTERVSTMSGGLAQSLFLGQRDVQLSLSGLYVDPAASTSQLQTLLDARDNADRLSTVITVDQFTMSGEFSLEDFSIQGDAAASPIAVDLALSSSGTVTTGGTPFDASVSMILDAFFNQTLATTAFELQDSTGPIVGSTRFTGNGYFGSVDLSMNAEDPASMSATLEGDGPIATAAVV